MKKKIIIVSIFIMSCLSAVLMHAQSLSQEQIDTYDTREGVFTQDDTVNTYVIYVEESQILGLEVLPLTGGIAPEYEVFDANGNSVPLIQDAYNSSQNVRVAFPTSGQYRIVVSNAAPSAGNYLISTKTLQSYTPESIFISDNSMMTDNFEEDMLNRYNFESNPTNVSTVIIYGENFEPGVVATVRNLVTSEDVGVINSPATASIFCLPAGKDDYSLEVMRADEATIKTYNVAVTSQQTTFCENSSITSLIDTLNVIDGTSLIGTAPDNSLIALDLNGTTGDIPTGSPEFPIDDDAVCGANAYDGSETINIRTLPSVTADVVAVADTGDTLNVLGQSRQGTWMNVRLLDGRTGYASANVLDLASACLEIDIPFVWYDTEQVLNLEVAAGLIDLADVNAGVTVGTDGIIINADGTVTNVADVNADATINNDGITINADANVAGQNANVDVSADNGGIEVDVNVGGLDVDLDVGDDGDDDDDDGGIDLDINLGLGG